MAEVIDLASVIAALIAYRTRLKDQDQRLKAMAVDRCIAIVRRFKLPN